MYRPIENCAALIVEISWILKGKKKISLSSIARTTSVIPARKRWRTMSAFKKFKKFKKIKHLARLRLRQSQEDRNEYLSGTSFVHVTLETVKIGSKILAYIRQTRDDSPPPISSPSISFISSLSWCNFSEFVTCVSCLCESVIFKSMNPERGRYCSSPYTFHPIIATVVYLFQCYFARHPKSTHTHT